MNINQKGFVNIVLIGIIVVIVGAVGYFAFVKKSEPVAKQTTLLVTAETSTTQQSSQAPATTPGNIPGGESTTPTETILAQQTQIATVVKEQGDIKSIYSKNGKIYLVIDYVGKCISDFKEAAKAILEDGKCPAGVTLDQLVQEIQGAGNVARICPSQPFGYGSGYCYFRNQNTQIRTLEISPDVVVLYPMHPYDFDTQKLYDGAYAYQITLDWLKDKYEYTKGNPFEITLVNNIVTVIRKIFVSAE